MKINYQNLDAKSQVNVYYNSETIGGETVLKVWLQSDTIEASLHPI